MSVTSMKTNDDKRVELEIKVDAETFEKAVDAAFKRNSKRMNVPGFRRGKAPRKMIERLYGEGVFYEEAVNNTYPAAYEDAVKRCPKQESFVECPDGVGTVSAVNVLKEQVKVRLEDATDQPPKPYLTSEIRVVRSGKGKRPEGYTAPPKAELEQLRTDEGERIRSGRKAGEAPADLGEVLDRYLGDGGQRQSGGQRTGNRRNRGGGQGQAQQPKQAQPRQKPSPKKETQPAGAQPEEAKGGQAQGQGQNHKRRYRPHHRRKSGGGQGAQQ